MEDKILEVIRAAIPEKEMGIVKLVFQERETFKADLAGAKDTIAHLEKQFKECLTEVVGLRNTKEANANKAVALDKREAEINAKELKLEISLAQIEARVIRECFDKVMKVPMVRKTIYKNISRNDYGSTSNNSENGNEDTVEE